MKCTKLFAGVLSLTLTGWATPSRAQECGPQFKDQVKVHLDLPQPMFSSGHRPGILALGVHVSTIRIGRFSTFGVGAGLSLSHSSQEAAILVTPAEWRILTASKKGGLNAYLTANSAFGVRSKRFTFTAGLSLGW